MSQIDNKKIPTILGTIVIVIIAITVGVFVWKYEVIKDQDNTQVQNVGVQENTSVNQQNQSSNDNQSSCLSDSNQKDSEWNTFKNDQFKFEIQYPSSFIYNEQLTSTWTHPPGEGVQYVINLGVPQKTTRKDGSNCTPSNNFLMYIANNENGLSNYIKNAKLTSGDVENSFEPVGTEKIASYAANIVKTCNMGGNCTKDVFFADDKYIYYIQLNQYFTLKNVSDKKILDRILSSLKFIK